MMKMRKQYLAAALCAALLTGILTGCGGSKDTGSADAGSAAAVKEDTTDYSKVASAADMTTVEEVGEDGMTPITGDAVADGTYAVTVDCSSSMFKITSAELTVKDGQMTAVLTMSGTGYRCVYMGTGEEAAKADPADYIFHEEDADGAHTFTVPVEALDQGISCAAFSEKKQQWYDRTLLFRSDSLPQDALGASSTVASLGLADGTYTVDVTLSGGSGRASVQSPATLTVANGEATATIVWSSDKYDYMMVGDTRYEPEQTEGNSTFTIPVSAFDCNLAVSADTTAMSQPYLIDYTLNFSSDSITPQ